MSWQNFKDKMKFAFAVTDGRKEITDEDIRLLDRIAEYVAKKRMASVAVMFLETVKPLNFIGSSVMTFFRPTVGMLLNPTEYERLEKILEKRCSVELLIERIELKEKERK